ncbi:MAG: ankyrin repeat domain-containing protein [bacterium]|nr:ankyrin repeat domain-containing protein [bacterium]
MNTSFKLGKMDKSHTPRSRRNNGTPDFERAKARAVSARSTLSEPEKSALDKRMLRCVSSSRDCKLLVNLLERGADPNARDYALDHTVLMIAAKKGKPELAEILLDWGADTDARGHGNVTAYEVAKTWQQWDVIYLFRERDVDCIPAR